MTVCSTTMRCYIQTGPVETVDHAAAIGRLDLLVVVVAAILIADVCLIGRRW